MTLPTISIFGTLESLCPSTSPPPFSPERSRKKKDEESRPPKRSKIEKNTTKIRKDIPRLFEALKIIRTHLTYNIVKLTILSN